MPFYRRRRVPGATYFFTVVTERRAPILCTDLARRLLHDSIEVCRRERPFELVATVLLPDHLHALWTLPEDDADYSERSAAIKSAFTHAWIESGGWEQARGRSRLVHRRRGVWQRHFWEHQIRDTADFQRHVDYIHYNPVKHGQAACPHAWKWSTFSKWVARDAYERSWCCACDGRVVKPPDFEGMEELEMA